MSLYQNDNKLSQSELYVYFSLYATFIQMDQEKDIWTNLSHNKFTEI